MHAAAVASAIPTTRQRGDAVKHNSPDSRSAHSIYTRPGPPNIRNMSATRTARSRQSSADGSLHASGIDAAGPVAARSTPNEQCCVIAGNSRCELLYTCAASSSTRPRKPTERQSRRRTPTYVARRIRAGMIRPRRFSRSGAPACSARSRACGAVRRNRSGGSSQPDCRRRRSLR